MKTQTLHIDGPAGALQVRVEAPAHEPAGLAVICHPHPQYGGNMDNKVVWSLARAALGRGFVAVRFNYRGVGESDGHYDEGTGETEDARAVVAWARQRWSAGPLLLMGFSFGAAIALRLAVSETPGALVTVAPPLDYFAAGQLPQPGCPWLLVHGDADEVVAWPPVRERLTTLSVPPQQEVFAGVGHFFHGELVALRECVEQWLARQT